MAIRAPSYTHEQLRAVADQFLKQHHPGGYLPVPIEEIIEFNFSLDIVPVPGLKDEFDVDAFITNDLTEIRVDRFFQQRRPKRYRFSLAHELAHLLIHRDIFAALKFKTIAEWKAAIGSIPADQYGWIEWQAYALGGLMLVPRAPLADLFAEKAADARRAGIEVQDMDAKLRRIIENSIGEHFEVSADVIAKRMDKDELWTRGC